MEEALESPQSDVQVRDLDNTLTFHVVLHNRAATFMYLYLNSGTVTVTVQNIRKANGSAVTDNSGLIVTNSRGSVTPTGATFVTTVTTIIYSTVIKVEATAYREFDIVISDKTKIKSLATPSFFSRWKMDMLAGCLNMESLFARGRIVKSGQGSDTQYLSDCSKLKTLWVECNPEIIMRAHNFESISDGVGGGFEKFHLLPRGFDFPKGGSYSFDISDFATYTAKAKFKEFTVAGSYSIPLRGVCGAVTSFNNFSQLSTLSILYTSITPKSYDLITLTGVPSTLNITSSNYNNNMESYQ